MRDVMGLSRVCRAVRVAKDPEAVVAAAIELTAGARGSFAVRARRRDKRFPVTSAQLAILIGARIQQEYGYPVNLRHPDITVFVEVDQSEVFVFTDGMAGQGGLPVSMSGRALVLMSGGIDSPVAAYRMMRRGLRCSYLHFSGMPLTGPESVIQGLRAGPRAGRGSRAVRGCSWSRSARHSSGWPPPASRVAADHDPAAAHAQGRARPWLAGCGAGRW